MDVAKRQISRASEEAQDAVSSGAWAYPITGILYLLSHPGLLQPLIPTIVKGLLISVAVVAGMFFFTYLPQVAALAFVSGPLAFIAAVPLVLGESYIVINYLARSILFDQAGIDLFDAVLAQKGQSALVENGKKASSTGGKKKALGSIVGNPLSRFSTDSVVRYLLTLPLNLIPVIGTAFFLGYNGYKSGPGYHARYFQLKGYDKEKRQAAIQRRRGAYTAFGTVAMVLNLIPGAAIFFTFSNAVGAALWAAKLENGGAAKNSATPASRPASAKKEL